MKTITTNELISKLQEYPYGTPVCFNVDEHEGYGYITNGTTTYTVDSDDVTMVVQPSLNPVIHLHRREEYVEGLYKALEIVQKSQIAMIDVLGKLPPCPFEVRTTLWDNIRALLNADNDLKRLICEYKFQE